MRCAGLWPAACLVLGAAGPALGQSLGARVDAAPDGRVRYSFAARPGVCGDGHTIRSGPTRDWEPACEPGPVRVVLHVEGGAIVEIDTYVGGRWRPGVGRVTDLGTVSARRAADHLLDLASRLDGQAAADAVLPATLADSVTVWPRLLRIARADTRPRSARKAALFWTSQAALEAIADTLGAMIQDPSEEVWLKKQAIFALSQRPREEGVPALIRVVRASSDRTILKTALFWLAQSEDPRALDLFEEILLDGR